VAVGGFLIVAAVRIPVAALLLLTTVEFVQSFAGAIYGIRRGTLTQTVTPDRLRGQVAGSSNFFGMAALTLGSLTGGLLGEAIGSASTMTIGAAGGLVAVGWLLFSPLPTFTGALEAEQAQVE
jgi:predicted MFS family arabinose efflux permease